MRPPGGGAAKKSKQTDPAGKGRSRYPVVALAVGVVLLAGGAYYLLQGGKSPKVAVGSGAVKKEKIRLRETRPTLAPEQFSGKVRSSYEIARQIPEVLDKLYCYCRCRENSGHLNLLSCYVDTHASA